MTTAAELQLNAVVVFDATFNHPTMRDITVGKEYTIVGMTDADEPQPFFIDDSGEENARALQVSENWRVVSTPTDTVTVYVEEPVKPAKPKHHYIASFAIAGKPVGDVGNVVITVEGEPNPATILYNLRREAAIDLKMSIRDIVITGVFKL